MSKKVSKTTVGLFMVVALVLIVVAVLVLGSGKFFKDNPKIVMYFQGSVKGLSIGSPINFRGVKVGKVTDIKMLLDPKDLSIMIPVYGELERGSLMWMGGAEAKSRFLRQKQADTGFLQKLIDRGMRAQLEMQSIVTGQLLIALDFNPDKPAKLVKADPKTMEVPTIPTPLQELAKRVENLPVEEIINKVDRTLSGVEALVTAPEVKAMLVKFNSTAAGIDKIVNSPETAAMLRATAQTVDDTRTLIKNIDAQVAPLSSEVKTLVNSIEKLSARLEAQIQPLIASLTQTSDAARISMKRMEEVTDDSPVVAYRLGQTLDELATTARALRLLTDTIQNQPESVIFGKKNMRGK